MTEDEKQQLLRDYHQVRAETEALLPEAEKASIELSKGLASNNTASHLDSISAAIDKVMRLNKKADKARAAIFYLDIDDAADLTHEGLVEAIKKWS